MSARSIVIGCDDDALLSHVIEALKKSVSFSHTISCAVRTADMVNIAASLKAELIIFCFYNNTLALKDFSNYTTGSATPVLCLVKQNDNEAMLFSRRNIVFTYPLDQIGNADCLGSRIDSIFRLGGGLSSAAADTHVAVQPAPLASFQTKDLSRYVMELDKKTEILSKVKDRISHLYSHVNDPIRAELNSIVSSIRLSGNDNSIWQDFKLYFEQNNPHFLLLLARKHPELTPKDLKYCCYLKMNMTNDDIRSLLGINPKSVRTHKYRLKKKMSLSKDQDLQSYLNSMAH